MSRVFQATQLEALATFWRIERQDGVLLGFTSHDRDLWFNSALHRAAPGMVPSAIRRTRGLDLDVAEVEGALSHDAISQQDLESGRFDNADVAIGVVDWETLEFATLYRGALGEIANEGAGFEAELRSEKAALQVDAVPRTSPTCRALFCGKECGLSAVRFTYEAVVTAVDFATNSVAFSAPASADVMRSGQVRWVDGPHAGLAMQVHSVSGVALVLDTPLDSTLAPGARAVLREGCDHTIATCTSRFSNAANFRGEPFLPGNDVLVRYPTGSTN